MAQTAAISRTIPVPDPEEEPEREAMTVNTPALGYSILANLGDEKQITVQCYVDSEEPIDGIHAKIDKAMRVIDRQKAKYRRADLIKEVEKMEKTLRQLEEDINRLEAQFETNQKALNDRIAANVAKIEEMNRAAYGRGRSGPVGQDKAQVTALVKENEQLTEQKAKAEADRGQAREQIAVSIGRYNDEIARAKEQIAECDELIGDGS